MPIDSTAFKAWASAFEKRSAYLGTKEETVDAAKKPIKNTLDELSKLKGEFASDLLRLNVIYACYQATMALSHENPGDEHRTAIDRGLAALKGASGALERVTSLVQQNPETVALALEFTHVDDLKDKTLRVPGGVIDALRILRPALRKLTMVSQLSKSDPHFAFLDTSYDCLDGPFLLFNRKEDRTRPSGPRIKYERLVESGLIFHLTYLFRYFTGAKLPSHNQGAIIRGDEIAVQGPMLARGKPFQGLVAHLFNATFEVQTHANSITGAQVRQRLKDLNDGGPGSTEKNFHTAFEHVEFAGWPAAE